MAKVRTDFPTAVHQILKTLQSGEPFTLNKLSQETKLNFRTVKKAVKFIQDSQNILRDMDIGVSSTSENLTIVHAKERAGLALYPENIQRLIVKTAYYPTSSREEEILAFLLIHNATGASKGQSIPDGDSKLKSLVEAEHIARTSDGRYYLTADGQMIARGALKLYPELREVSRIE